MLGGNGMRMKRGKRKRELGGRRRELVLRRIMVLRILRLRAVRVIKLDQ